MVLDRIFLFLPRFPEGQFDQHFCFHCSLIKHPPYYLLHSMLLVCADNMKLFMRIKFYVNDKLRQTNLNHLVSCDELSNFQLKVAKYQIMTLLCRKNHHSFVSTFMALPFSSRWFLYAWSWCIFFKNLSPRMHIEEICCQTFKLLRFVVIDIHEFKFSIYFKILYFDLVRSLLDYESVLWTSNISDDACMVK